MKSNKKQVLLLYFHLKNYIMKDWNQNEIEVSYNKFGEVSTLHPDQNLIHNKRGKWPSPELAIKISQKSLLEADFIQEFRERCKSSLGYYSNLQAIKNVDVMIWSVFGTIARSPKNVIKSWLEDLYENIGIGEINCEDAQIFLWRNFPQLKNIDNKNNEIDIKITTKDSIVCLLADWSTQTNLYADNSVNERIKNWSEFLNKQNMTSKSNKKNIYIIGVSFRKNWFDNIKIPENCKFYNITWNKVCWIKSHPDAKELLNYYLWKRNLCINRPLTND